MKKQVLQVKNKKLRQYIYDYYVIEFTTNILEPMIVPMLGFPVLHFHYGAEGQFYNYKNITNESVFIGQLTKHYQLLPHKGLKFIGVNFKPYGLYNLLGIAPKQLTNACIESKYFFGEETITKIKSQLEDTTNEKKVDILETLLTKYIDKNKSLINYYCDNIVDEIEKMDGLIKIQNFSNEKISLRSIERYFNKVIGISPKKFSQIVRHKLIMQFIYEKQTFDWQDAIFQGYYTDHSHLTKDFQKFSETKPIQYLTMKNYFAETLLKE